ncbi:MAG TPA: CocE/NonD family hydrolase [Novosphingobium sp.]|nr:CocE/NonD family hydrolase [Novosphingobium sp.]
MTQFSDVSIGFDVEIPMADGTVLRADVYLPEKLPAPVLISRTPYLKGSIPGLAAAVNPVSAVRKGFAVVLQDVRGRGASDGDFVPFVNEASDGAETARWAARQDWCNGKIGLFGSSYMGATQLQAAIEGPAEIKAMAPIQAVSEYYEGRSYRGGAFEIGALTSISLWNLGAGTLLRGNLDTRTLRQRFGEARVALSNLAKFLKATPFESLRETELGKIAPFLFTWWENDRASDPYWAPLRISDNYGKIDAAGLHVTSWFDQFHVGALRNYEGLRKGAASEAAREGQRLVVGPWAHYPPKSTVMGSVRVGDIDFGLDAFVDLEAQQLSWFRGMLADEPNAPAGPRVRIFVMGRNVWRNEEEWPLARAKDTPLYLDTGNGGLGWDQPQAESTAEFRFDPNDPVPTRGGAHMVLDSAFPQGPVAQGDLADRADVLYFRSAVLEEEVEVTGWVNAELWVRSSAPATDFTARLVDVWPDGSEYVVCDGIRRLHPGELAKDGWTKIVVEMGATSQAFLKGHCLAVQISSSNFPRFDIASNTEERVRLAPQRVVADQQVACGGVHASRLILPVVPAEPAQG